MRNDRLLFSKPIPEKDRWYRHSFPGPAVDLFLPDKFFTVGQQQKQQQQQQEETGGRPCLRMLTAIIYFLHKDVKHKEGLKERED